MISRACGNPAYDSLKEWLGPEFYKLLLRSTQLSMKFIVLIYFEMPTIISILTWYLYTVKSRLSERRLSETTGLFEDDGQSQLFSLLSIAIKLPIIRISIIRKNQFFEVIRQPRLKKLLLNYPSRFEVQMSRMVIMISLFGRVPFTHSSDLSNKVATGYWHRINIHTVTCWTVKWINGVFN